MRSEAARPRYEARFAEYVGADYARAFTRGRQALYVVLKALGIGQGDSVGVCGYTCLSVAEAVKTTGADCVYLDVDESLCIDPNSLSERGRAGFKVVILQHTFGNPGRLGELLKVTEDLGIQVIEDCAHALGCSWRGRHLGSFGVAAIYSFQWGKPYSTGQGGMLVVNSKSLIPAVDEVIKQTAVPDSLASDFCLEVQRRIAALVQGGAFESLANAAYFFLRRIKLIKGSFNLTGKFSYNPGYVRYAGGFMSRAGLKALDVWPTNAKRKRENAERIAKALEGSGLSAWPVQAEAGIIPLRYPIMLDRKDEAMEACLRGKAAVAGWYSTPVHPLEGDDLRMADYLKGSCPNAELAARRIVNLPVNTFPEGAIAILSEFSSVAGRANGLRNICVSQRDERND